MSLPYIVARKAKDLRIGDKVMEQRPGCDIPGHPPEGCHTWTHVATFLAHEQDGYMLFAIETEAWLGFPKIMRTVSVSLGLWGAAAGFPDTLFVEEIA